MYRPHPVFQCCTLKNGKACRSGDVIGHDLESPPMRMTTRDVTCSLCKRAREQLGGDSKPCPKPCPITSPDRVGLPIIKRATLKNWVRPGYEARSWVRIFMAFHTL